MIIFMVCNKKSGIHKMLFLIVTISCCLISCQAIDEEEPISSASEKSLESSVASPEDSQQDTVPISQSEEMSFEGIPQPDGVSPASQSDITESVKYESGKILLSHVGIDGTTNTIVINDDTTKKQILGYIDGMQASDYTVRNTPPGGGQIIDIEVHRNSAIEQYIFSSQTKDGNALGKNLYNSDSSKWAIVDKDAFDYLLNLLLIK